MKITDISNELQPIRLTERPGDVEKDTFDAKGQVNNQQTRGKAIKNKFKKHTPFNKAARDKATIEDETRKEAKGIKQEFKKWMASTNSAMTGEEFINFITQKHSDLAPFATDVAVNLKMYQPPAKPAADPAADPAAAAAPATAPSGDVAGDSDTVADKVDGDNLELAPDDAATGKQDITASKGDDEKPKIDTSASIYESRFRRIQLLERDLKDNDLDTLIVRLIQAGRKGGVSSPQGGTADPSGEDKQEQSSSSSSNSEDDGMLKLDPNYEKPLKKILSIVKTSKEFDDNAKRAANQILRSLS